MSLWADERAAGPTWQTSSASLGYSGVPDVSSIMRGTYQDLDETFRLLSRADLLLLRAISAAVFIQFGFVLDRIDNARVEV